MTDDWIMAGALCGMVAVTAALGYLRGYVYQSIEDNPYRIRALRVLQQLLLGTVVNCYVIWGALIAIPLKGLYDAEIKQSSAIVLEDDGSLLSLYATLFALSIGLILYSICYRAGVARVESYWRSTIKPISSRFVKSDDT